MTNPQHEGSELGAAAPSGAAAEKAARKQEAAEALKAVTPWEGAPQRADKVLLAVIFAIPAFYMVLMPFRPHMIAHQPLLLILVQGGTPSVAAGGAFAAIGELPLWLVLAAGVVGKVKFDWLFWWVGHRWGRGFARLFARGPAGERFAARAESLPPWIMRAAVLLSYVPGVPGVLVHGAAGWTGMRLTTFLLLDAAGAAVLVAAVAGAGYASGQTGVDIVMLVDSYALWITLAIVLVLPLLPALKARRSRAGARRAAGPPDGA